MYDILQIASKTIFGTFLKGIVEFGVPEISNVELNMIDCDVTVTEFICFIMDILLLLILPELLI